jgi:hypothetical protein
LPPYPALPLLHFCNARLFSADVELAVVDNVLLAVGLWATAGQPEPPSLSSTASPPLPTVYVFDVASPSGARGLGSHGCDVSVM